MRKCRTLETFANRYTCVGFMRRSHVLNMFVCGAVAKGAHKSSNLHEIDAHLAHRLSRLYLSRPEASQGSF
jgi:hypothetical protein